MAKRNGYQSNALCCFNHNANCVRQMQSRLKHCVYHSLSSKQTKSSFELRLILTNWLYSCCLCLVLICQNIARLPLNFSYKHKVRLYKRTLTYKLIFNLIQWIAESFGLEERQVTKQTLFFPNSHSPAGSPKINDIVKMLKNSAYALGVICERKNMFEKHRNKMCLQGPKCLSVLIFRDKMEEFCVTARNSIGK